MKKYLLGIVAIVLAISFSAFTIEKNRTPKATSGEVWFVFNGTDPTDLNDASKYSLDQNGSAPSVCPTNTSSPYRCEILATPSGSPSMPVLGSIIDERKRATP